MSKQIYFEQFATKCPQSVLKAFQDLIVCYNCNYFDQITEILNEISQTERQFYELISVPIFQEFPQLRKQQEIFIIQQQFTQQGERDLLEVLELLKKQQYQESSSLLKNLMRNQSQAAFNLYQQLISFDSALEQFLTRDQVFCLKTPDEMRIQVQKVIEILSLQMDKLTIQRQEEYIIQFKDYCQVIQFENEQTFQELYDQFISKNQFFSQIEKPKTCQQQNLESLTEICKILKSGNKILTISDFTSVHVGLESKDLESNIIDYYGKEIDFSLDQLQILLFDYIKKKLSFSKLVTAFSKQKIQTPFTRLQFFQFLMRNSDKWLRIMLCIACSQFMPIPLLAYEVDLQNNQMKHKIHTELFYIFEKYQSIFTFKLQVNPNKGPIGCTSLINQVFNRDFEEHNSRLTNYGTIEIQFDQNFVSPMCIPVADGHGYQQVEILEKFYSLFDIFIIHVLSNEADQALLQAQIGKIKQIKEDSLIIVIEHNLIFSQEAIKATVQNQNIQLFQICQYQRMEEQPKINLKDRVLNLIQQKVQNYKQFIGDYNVRINSMEAFYNIIKANNLYCTDIKKSFELINKFMNEVNRSINILKDKSFLPCNHIMDEVFSYEIQLQKESEIEQEVRDQIWDNLELKKNQLKMQKQTKIVKILIKIIDSDNFIGISNIISKLLKGFLDKELQLLYEQRTQYRADLYQEDISNQNKEQIIQKMKEVTAKIDQNLFSLEFVIRELYYLGQYSQVSTNQINIGQESKDSYFRLAELQISQGQPFEIIDGNNLQFISDIYDIIHREDQDQVLVVSVIGPQSSGKSLLLNFLFGTQFLSAAGRCTKGVYASLLTISNNQNSKYKKILLLDTEGILSARDEQFDRRIVFYIMCVSHVILICNKGEMNRQMAEVIKLAIDAISTLKENVIEQPSVNFIMNMQDQINEFAMEESIKGISQAILEIEKKRSGNQQPQSQKLKKMFKITKENVFILPFAFDRSSEGNFISNQTSFDFSLKLEPLRKQILQIINQLNHNIGGHFTVQDWFKFASKH